MKTRRALSLILVMAMILSMFTMILPASAAPSGTRAISATRSRTNYTCYTDEQLMEILELSDISELNTLRSAAYDAVMQNTNWDLSAYNYNWDNLSHKTALTSLIFDHPECFFINNIGGAAYNDGRIAYLTPKYKEGYDVAMEQHAALEAAAQEIMCRFQRTELSDLELAVLIHDYLAANCDYHIATLALSDAERLALGKFSAYDLLVEGSAVCQGYAEAYAYLMMQFGINCGLCDSEALNHAWNILELNGKEYHVDVTWDDPTVDTYIGDGTWAEPTSDVYGNVTHTNMFLSTVALQSNHKANDFSGTPANTEFDTAFWQGINSSFCLVGDTIYFINSDQKLCTWDHIDTNKENGDESAYEIVELMDLSATWYATNTGAWPRYFGRLSTDGERLFYSTPNEIYEYFPATNTSKSVYKVEDKIDEASGYKYNIFGFHFDGDNFLLNYYYTPNFNASNVAESVHIYDYPVNASETHVYGDPVYITFPCETDGEVRYDCIYCGFSKFETIPVAGHSEETVPGKTATCTEDGLTDGAVCSVCGETTLKQEPIPAPGHDWLAATCTEPVKCSVCGEQQEGESGYILQDPTTYIPQDGDQIVIAANYNGIYHAMSTGTSGKLAGVDLTVVDGKITSEKPPVWTLEPTESGVALKENGKYLARGSSTNFAFTDGPYEWLLTTGADGYQLTANADSERQVTYQTSGDRFGPYSNTNTSGYVFDLQFFKYVEGGGALGHKEVPVPGYAATCTEDGLTDGSKCSVCGEILKEQEADPAPGHDYQYTYAGNDNHTVTCTRCDLNETAGCNYEDGVCTYCGYGGSEDPAPEGGYEKATSIAVGDKVVLVCEAKNMELSSVSTYGTGTAYSGTVDAIYVLEVVAGSIDGTFAFMNDGNYLSWSSSNSLKTSTSVTDNSSWTVTFENGNAIIRNAKDSSRQIQWNASSPRFAAYTSKQTPVQFYKYVSAGTGECNHEWDEGTVTVPATCYSEGEKTYTCKLCSEVKTESMKTLDHNYGEVFVTAPSCTEGGFTTYECTNDGCEYAYIDDRTPPLGHDWVAATCTSGTYCSVCNASGNCYEQVTGIDQLKDNDQIVIIAKVDGLYKAMNAQITSAIAATDVEIQEGQLVGEEIPTWTLEKVSDGFALSVDGTYLKHPGNDADFRTSQDPFAWTFGETANSIRISSGTRGIIYRASADAFKAYGTANIGTSGYYADLLVFKYIDGSTLPHEDADGNNLCDDCGTYIEPAALLNRSISLDGNIGVNFYMSISPEDATDSSARMLFTQEGKEPVEVPLSHAVIKENRGQDAYVFTYEVSAKEMTDTITAQFIVGNFSTKEYTYSVRTYADNTTTNLSEDTTLVNLLHAMLHYGAASQIQFDYHTERLANAGLEPVDYTGLTIEGYDIIPNQGTKLVSFAGTSLLLKSETTLRYFFQADSSVESLTASYNGEPLEVHSRGNMLYVDIKNIGAPALDEEFTITIHDGVEEANVVFSPMSYCQSVYYNDRNLHPKTLQDVAAAIYLYNQAANIYFESAQ